jgi:uncharacterized membrane protein (DUF485 family)
MAISFHIESLEQQGYGVVTLGIPIGVFIIVAAFVLTGIYVRRANSEFDSLTRQIIEEARQ